MEQEFLVFWYDGNDNRVSIVKVKHPPHEKPRGTILEDLLSQPLLDQCLVMINGYVELPGAAWNQRAHRELGAGNGQPLSLECGAEGWKIHT